MIGPVLTALVATCPPGPTTPVALVTLSPDAALASEVPVVQRRLRTALAERVALVDAARTRRAWRAEGGAADRAATVIAARAQLEQATQRFRELDDASALARIAEVTTRLVAVHQDDGAIPVLARAHRLAAAIYLARGRMDAVQARLHRALDLDPDLTAPRHRFDPRLADELAAARASAPLRPTGRVEIGQVRALEGDGACALQPGRCPLVEGATVYLDGAPVGRAPLTLEAVPAGRHLLRVSADGFLSDLSSIAVAASGARSVTVRLLADPERRALEELGPALAARADVEGPLTALARRAEADHALLAEVRLAPVRDPSTGTATVAVHLRGSGGLGHGWAPSLAPEDLRRAVDDVLACRRLDVPARRAPALVAVPGPRTTPGPRRAPAAWWTQPWPWAIAAGVVLGGVGALVAARASSGPPNSLSVTLVPRP